MASIAERVSAGVAWLDGHHPGWVQQVDPDGLDMDRRCGCILGQVLGDFFAAPLTSAESVAYGFLTRALSGRTSAVEIEALTVAWRAWFDVEARRRESACCPCRGLLCNPDCTCPECPHDETELTDDDG